MTFKITKTQQKLIDKWTKEQDLIAVGIQKSEVKSPTMWHQMSWSDGVPESGAIGGGLEYIFTPTSIGTMIKIKHLFTKEILDISEYDKG